MTFAEWGEIALTLTDRADPRPAHAAPRQASGLGVVGAHGARMSRAASPWPRRLQI